MAAPTTHTDHGHTESARHGVDRSPEWPDAARHHLQLQPTCMACRPGMHSQSKVQVHHIFPFHYCVALGRPDLELDQRNLITLCEEEAGHPAENHHLLIGHLDDFRSSNLEVITDAQLFQGLSAVDIKRDSRWKQKEAARLKPLDRMTPQDKADFVALMNSRLPQSGGHALGMLRMPPYVLRNDGAGPYAIFACEKCRREFRSQPLPAVIPAAHYLGQQLFDTLLHQVPDVGKNLVTNLAANLVDSVTNRLAQAGTEAAANLLHNIPVFGDNLASSVVAASGQALTLTPGQLATAWQQVQSNFRLCPACQRVVCLSDFDPASGFCHDDQPQAGSAAPAAPATPAAHTAHAAHTTHTTRAAAHCPKCGAVTQGAKFCPNCGTKLS